MGEFRQLTVSSVAKETESAVCVTFDLPDAMQDDFRFSHGQYLTLKTDIDGVEVRRSYSICAGVDDPDLRVAIKHIEGGAFSTYANESLRQGDILEVLPPAGAFTCELDRKNENILRVSAAG